MVQIMQVTQVSARCSRVCRAAVNYAEHNHGWNPLYCSAHAGHAEVCNMLLDSRAEVDKCISDCASTTFLAQVRLESLRAAEMCARSNAARQIQSASRSFLAWCHLGDLAPCSTAARIKCLVLSFLAQVHLQALVKQSMSKIRMLNSQL